MGSTKKYGHNKVATKEEDDEACVYAMLLSTFQVFPAILNAAIELKVLDKISEKSAAASGDGFLSVSDIASELPTQHSELHDRVDRMLRVLASFKVLDWTTRTNHDGQVERIYKLSLAGSYFLQSQTESLASFSNLQCHPATAKVWLNIKEAILDGGVDLFNKVHGITMWKYMEKEDTKLNQTFNKAMAGMSAIHMRKYLEAYDGFQGVSTLVDVGGGTGQSLQAIISKHPHIKGINFDLPQVIQHAPPHPRIEHVGGDMYASVPKGDAIMVKATCHNWSDEKCVALLKNCHKALPENGKVIILDMILPEEPDSSDATKYASIVDNSMFIQAGGRERTEKQFEKLCKNSGFSSFRVAARALSVFGVVEFYK